MSVTSAKKPASKKRVAHWEYMGDGWPAFVLSVDGAEDQLGHIVRDRDSYGDDNFAWLVYVGADGASSEADLETHDFREAVRFLERLALDKDDDTGLALADEIGNEPKESDYEYNDEDPEGPNYESDEEE